MSGNKDSNDLVHRGPKPSTSDTLPREKLPDSLQKMVDDEETFFEQIYDGKWVLHKFCLPNEAS